MSTVSHLDPIPKDYAELVSRSSVSHTTNLANVSTIISRLELAKSQLISTSSSTALSGETDLSSSASDTLLPLSTFVKQSNANAGKESKEWGNAITRLAKSVDKKFPGPPPPLFPSSAAPPPPSSAPYSTLSATPLHPSLLSLSPAGSFAAPSSTDSLRRETPFSSPEQIAALNSTIAHHLARIGAFDSLTAFLEESQTPSPVNAQLIDQLKRLHAIIQQLESGHCLEAIEWVLDHPELDPNRDLEFELRKEEFIRILLAGTSFDQGTEDHDMNEVVTTDAADTIRTGTPPNPHSQAALAYGGQHFRHLLTATRTPLVCALLTAPLYMPFSKLVRSPYGSIFEPYSRSPAQPSTSTAASTNPTNALCARFSAAYLRSLGLPKQSPLTVVTDVGGSGAMAKIMKVRAVMKEKRTEWSASGELPVEIPLPIEYRYHSIFACPVSKEQSTPTNPPMLLPCGHCIAKESLTRLARGTPTLKCPYCPIVSHVNACVRVHF
ncbi:ubiquitin-protein ligase RMD5 [Sporobolomyces koalae]|uniref:ubiquitin-protein ligase RMD5 n=1 Tax=Sporobolomyces koalae TaxID=500713 RepID=UPI00317E3B1B